MPENPRERNFRKLLEQHRVPQETYDFVCYIFSASVIGENPRLSGFDFDNPMSAMAETGQEPVRVVLLPLRQQEIRTPIRIIHCSLPGLPQTVSICGSVCPFNGHS